MAFQTAPAWMENSDQHHAVIYRQMLAGVTGGAAGVVNAAALAVSEHDGTADMSVDVAPGGAFIPSTRSVHQGSYYAYNDAVINVPITASHPTNDRIDRVLVQVRDSAQDVGLPEDDNRIYVIEGTPASVPTLPPVDVDDWIELARVLVPAGATAITNGDITDVRQMVGAPIQLVYEASSTFVKASYPGLKAVRVRAVGGGGGGAGARSATAGQLSVAAGGGSGCYSESVIPVESLAASETVTVGAGGSGGAGATPAPGSAGGASKFGGHVDAPGGQGGQVSITSGAAPDVGGASPPQAAGVGQIATASRVGSGPIRLDGTQGMSGAGGDSVLGAGGRHLADTSSAGTAGEAGGGGSGAMTRNGDPSYPGGAGGKGLVIVELMF